MIPASGKISIYSRNAAEIDGKRKQYSGPEDPGIIRRLPVVSPPGRTGI